MNKKIAESKTLHLKNGDSVKYLLGLCILNQMLAAPMRKELYPNCSSISNSLIATPVSSAVSVETCIVTIP